MGGLAGSSGLDSSGNQRRNRVMSPSPLALQGWRQGPNGHLTKLCLSPTRSRALRVMQALVLAGADASGIIKEMEEGSDAAELRSVGC